MHHAGAVSREVIRRQVKTAYHSRNCRRHQRVEQVGDFKCPESIGRLFQYPTEVLQDKAYVAADQRRIGNALGYGTLEGNLTSVKVQGMLQFPAVGAAVPDRNAGARAAAFAGQHCRIVHPETPHNFGAQRVAQIVKFRPQQFPDPVGQGKIAAGRAGVSRGNGSRQIPEIGDGFVGQFRHPVRIEAIAPIGQRREPVQAATGAKKAVQGVQQGGQVRFAGVARPDEHRHRAQVHFGVDDRAEVRDFDFKRVGGLRGVHRNHRYPAGRSDIARTSAHSAGVTGWMERRWPRLVTSISDRAGLALSSLRLM